jgi:hypothetical protein
MIVILVNKQEHNNKVQYDASFIENQETLLRLGGIIFDNEPTFEEIEERINDIIKSNFENIILEKIEII